MSKIIQYISLFLVLALNVNAQMLPDSIRSWNEYKVIEDRILDMAERAERPAYRDALITKAAETSRFFFETELDYNSFQMFLFFPNNIKGENQSFIIHKLLANYREELQDLIDADEALISIPTTCTICD